MASTAIDSAIFRDIFSSEAMRRVFTDEHRLQCYLDIEAALAQVQAKIGLIPQHAANEIAAKCTLDSNDMAKLKIQTELIGYPVLPVVQQLDITDTATIMQIREALALVEQDLKAIQPTVGEFGGAAGTLASLGDAGLRVQEGLMAELGLGQPEIAWHTARDRIAEVGCFLGLVTGTLGKIATDMKLLMQTEVCKAFEPYTKDRGSSSTMPQKRNPISCNYIHACTVMVRQLVAALLDAMVEDHERSTGPWESEWIAVPEIFLLSSGSLQQAQALLTGLEVDTTRMRSNLDITNGLICAEAVMMGLAPHLDRQRAHNLVYKISRRAIVSGRPLLDLLMETQEISSVLDRAVPEKLLDPARYLGLSGEMIDRVLGSY
ncbi:3-carboxy-cis,cis-muconate cycloisomerase [Ilyonectria robusta]|uniref:3-carboxy-cis,cis-muconate cycloisomerase n=1 Tax=Ilyonectria robusta TaxID=1079257 RepID=UPI001E8CBFCE|nr:3-carboxy-cis,cis-muconate cycloisomerase [Ilyonectria robusta]KAH8661098.1 3-carboxy-cis,cis-muconate cycloisomerase [Ilyonectria robusta]